MKEIKTTPSYISLREENGESIVVKGETAKRQAVTRGAVYGFKRLMGHKCSDDVVKNTKVSYNIKPAKNGDARVEMDVQGKKELWSPEQLSANILQKNERNCRKLPWTRG